MTYEQNISRNFSSLSSEVAKAEDLFLPSVIEVVRHMARMAAKNDYEYFVATGEIPYADSITEVCDD